MNKDRAKHAFQRAIMEGATLATVAKEMHLHPVGVRKLIFAYVAQHHPDKLFHAHGPYAYPADMYSLRREFTGHARGEWSQPELVRRNRKIFDDVIVKQYTLKTAAEAAGVSVERARQVLYQIWRKEERFKHAPEHGHGQSIASLRALYEPAVGREQRPERKSIEG